MRTLTVLKRSAVALLIAVIAGTGTVAVSDVTRVNSLRLEKNASLTKYIIEQTGAADYQDFLLNNPKRLVVDLVGARHDLGKYRHEGDGNLVKAVRTSQFSNDPDEVTRIVFDLAENAKYKVTKRDNTIEVIIYSDEPAPDPAQVMEANPMDSSWDAAPKVAPSQPATPAPSSFPSLSSTEASETSVMMAEMMAAAPHDTKVETVKETPREVTEEATTATEPAKVETPATQTSQSQWSAPQPTPAGNSQWDNLKAVPVEAKPTQAPLGVVGGGRARSYPSELTAYTGLSNTHLGNKNITMDVQGADIKTVLRSIAEFSGQDIITGPSVAGAVTVHLTEVNWRDALDIILKANGYGLRVDNGIYRVQSLDVLHDDEVDIAMVSQKKEDLEPLVSKVIELNFTNAKEMQSAMAKVSSKRGSISIEKGANAVIINDIPKIVERISAMIVSLDRKVSQVEITAKMVDVDVEATREIGVNWDFMNIMVPGLSSAGNAFSGIDLADPFSGLTVGTVQSWGAVMATIEALEKDNKAHIISNPRITTADNIEATILVGKEIPLIVSDEAGNPITELKKTGIVLRVTPHVNSDNTITLDLHPEISDLSSQATVQGGLIISIVEADTRVLVRDGETAVIGGLITDQKLKSTTGIPGLKNIPILGNLFKFQSETTKQRELIIFVTPRIVDFGETEMLKSR